MSLWRALGIHHLLKRFARRDHERFLERLLRNANEEPIRVEHASLEKFSEESDFKAHCPSCETGLLLVQRDQETMRIRREDRCISCAQRFVYADTEIGGERLPKEHQ